MEHPEAKHRNVRTGRKTPVEPVVDRSLSRRFRGVLANLMVPRGILMSTLDITSISIPIKDLPPELDGYTIAQVSDLHVGEARYWVPKWSPEAAEAIREAAPDVVVNTGDFVWGYPPADKTVPVAAQFVVSRAGGDGQIPSIAILGNHDYYVPESSRLVLHRKLVEAGITVLTNELLKLEHGGSTISFVGITDWDDQMERGIEILRQAPHPRIALVHMPDLVEEIPSGLADLVLSGHTHGGQIAVPFLERAIVRRGSGSNYLEGLYTINDMPVYVNRGLGFTGYPVRFRARPEVTLVRLTR